MIIQESQREVSSYIVETDAVTSWDNVTVKPGDSVRLMNGDVRVVFWVGIHKPSYCSMIGVQPQQEHGAVCFRQIRSVVGD